MILSTPVKLAYLAPDDWSRWWSIWEEHAQPLHKVNRSPNDRAGLHVGFDFVKVPWFRTSYEASFVDLSTLYPSLYEKILSTLGFDVLCARFVTSRSNFPAHMDNFIPEWSLRCLFHCTDANSQWYYVDRNNQNRRDLVLPPDSNWWMYLDGKVKHGTTYVPEHPKILLQVYANLSVMRRFADQHINDYPEYAIDYDPSA